MEGRDYPSGLHRGRDPDDQEGALLDLREHARRVDGGSEGLTYAFASPALARHIAGRIHPPLDQHAGHERGRAGNPVCTRLGFAVDLVVPGVDSRVVAGWIVEHRGFDRLYFYGSDRPIHVSAGPGAAGQIVQMRRGPSGRLVPRVVTSSMFMSSGPGR